MPLTDRQREIKERLDRGMTAPAIAKDLDISRNAVYQQIQRMRRNGTMPPDFTPTGVPVREARPRPGADTLARLLAPEEGGDRDAVAGAYVLLLELRRVRDELDTIARRLSTIVPR